MNRILPPFIPSVFHFPSTKKKISFLKGGLFFVSIVSKSSKNGEKTV